MLPDWVRDRLRMVLPPGWRKDCEMERGYATLLCYKQSGGMTAIVSGRVEADGRRWIHLSVAHPRYCPSFEQLASARDALLGPEIQAVQVLSARSRHVNIHPNCLHCFVCADGDGLPDFRAEDGTL